MYPHRIRLRGPWECQERDGLPGNPDAPDAQADTSGPTQLIALPYHWPSEWLHKNPHRVHLVRRFGWPGRIDPYERVWITCRDATGLLDVHLNGERLQVSGSESEYPEADITRLLKARNQLLLDAVIDPGFEGAWGDIALEVRCLAFLRSVKAWLAEESGGYKLHVQGNVVGASDQRLEIYVLLAGTGTLYQVVDATPGGSAFELVTRTSIPKHFFEEITHPLTLTIDLVCAATVWYRVECPLRPSPPSQKS